MIRFIDAGLTNSGPPSANVYRRLRSSSGLNSFVSIVVCLEKSSKLRGIVGLEPHNCSTHKRSMTFAPQLSRACRSRISAKQQDQFTIDSQRGSEFRNPNPALQIGEELRGSVRTNGSAMAV